MSETWYVKSWAWRDEIEPIEVVKSTDKTLVVRIPGRNGFREERRAIYSDCYQHYRTVQEAVADIQSKLDLSIDNARENVRKLEERRSKFLAAVADGSILNKQTN